VTAQIYILIFKEIARC